MESRQGTGEGGAVPGRLMTVEQVLAIPAGYARPSRGGYRRRRARLVARLEPLSADVWSRTATVVGAGKPLEHTVHTYANGLARHERTHWKQVEKTVKAILR